MEALLTILLILVLTFFDSYCINKQNLQNNMCQAPSNIVCIETFREIYVFTT